MSTPLLPKWLPKRGDELGLFAELNFKLKIDSPYLSAWCFYDRQWTYMNVFKQNINDAQHNHNKTIANTKMYSGSEHSWLLHPLPKISLGIFTIFTPEYSRVVLHQDHNSNPLWFYTETHQPTWFSQANQEPRWFYRKIHQPTWFSQANQEPRWFSRKIH